MKICQEEWFYMLSALLLFIYTVDLSLFLILCCLKVIFVVSKWYFCAI